MIERNIRLPDTGFRPLYVYTPSGSFLLNICLSFMTSPPRLILKLKIPTTTNKMPLGDLYLQQPTNTSVSQSLTNKDFLGILELCSGVLSTLNGVKGERSAALKGAAEEVKGKLHDNLLGVEWLDFDDKFKAAATEFDKRTKRIEREERIKSVTKKAFGMKMPVEEAAKGMDYKELKELQTKLKEVEQIIGKRKASEVNE